MGISIAYGMTSKSLTEQLNGNGFPITQEEGKRLYESYDKDFRVGVGFLREAGEVAFKRGWLHNIGGRRRYWIAPDPLDYKKYPKGVSDFAYKGRIEGIKREGGNFLIQSVNADMTKHAMVLIRNYKKKHKIRTEFMNQVYDEIVTRTHKDDSPHFSEVKKKLMLEAAGFYLKNIPMEVEGHVGPTWTK
jgi:DNA polymerase I-like protein with 3'-5' exonuclease and polymerase domains